MSGNMSGRMIRMFALSICAIAATILGACRSGEQQSITSMDVAIVGHDHHWLTRYPGPDGLLGTADDLGSKDGVRLPEGTDVHLTLASADYAYIFRVEELGLNELAALVHTANVTIRTGEPIAFTVQGDVVCGFPDPNLVSEIRIENRSDFQSWLETLEPWQDLPPPPTASGARNGGSG